MFYTKRKYDKIILWLDDDMKIKSSKFANNARCLGINCTTLFTEKDPKAYTDQEVSHYLIQHLTDQNI